MARGFPCEALPLIAPIAKTLSTPSFHSDRPVVSQTGMREAYNVPMTPSESYEEWLEIVREEDARNREAFTGERPLTVTEMIQRKAVDDAAKRGDVVVKTGQAGGVERWQWMDQTFITGDRLDG